MAQTPRKIVWTVLIGLAIRILVGLFFLPERMDPGNQHFKFDYEVGEIAASIASGHGFSDPYPYYAHSGPSALIPPVYPLLLAGLFKLFGTFSVASAVTALLISSLISSLTAIPIYAIGERCFSPRVAIASAWLWAFFPYSIFVASSFPFVTTLTTLLLTILILYAIRLESTNRLSQWFGFGLLAGFAGVADPSILGAVPFIAGWACYRVAKHGGNWKLSAAVATLAMMILPAPWVARNFIVFHQPVFLRDGFWLSFRVGNTPDESFWTDDALDPSHNEGEVKEMARVGELAFMAEKRRDSLIILREHPRAFAVRVLRRIIYLWTGYWSLRHEYLEQEPLDPANIPVLTTFTVLTVWGAVRMYRERIPERWLFILVLFSFPVVYYLTRPTLRYRHPIDPLVVLLSMYAILPRLDAWRESRRKKKELAVAAGEPIEASVKKAATGALNIAGAWQEPTFGEVCP